MHPLCLSYQKHACFTIIAGYFLFLAFLAVFRAGDEAFLEVKQT